ncbi:MAG: zinc ribbon domain-containing protein [Anaerolineae bacterium]|nr:zinc ribbon domain-containing protein [Anaerolineae bacterium]
MQVICPQCGEPVLAENINIQRMAAVCPACHTVFQFDPSVPTSKIKQRKMKQPPQITADETDNGDLKIAFRTNFQLDSNEAVIVSVVFSGILTFMTLIMAAAAAKAPIFPLGFGFFTLIMYYIVALQVYNQTHIEINDEQITVSRKPLPNVFSQLNTVSLSGIQNIRYEETPASKKEGYDTPRYHVWAEMVDGNRKLIVGDLIEDYAIFVTQRLNEQLNPDTNPDVAHLLDNEAEIEDGQAADELITPSKARHN